MGSLQIGRVTLPIREQAIRSKRLPDGLNVSGWLEIVEEPADKGLLARTYRDDLLGHMREQEVVPVVSDGVAVLDGFYRVAGVEVETISAGIIFDFSIDLQTASFDGWSSSDLKFESRYTAATLVNDFSITTASEALLAPPPHTAFDPGVTMPTSMTRTLESGYALKVYRDVPLGRSSVKWTASPADYLTGAVKIGRA